MGNIAASYSELGRHREALAMQEKSLEFQRRVLPENHPDIGQSYFSLAVSHRRDGNLQRSLEGARQALRIFQATMTPLSDCVEKARALVIDLTGKIASSYDELGRHREAVALQENCVEEMRLLFPENHPRYAESGGT
jgi:tetratricopeptide (TPR) repeat protein